MKKDYSTLKIDYFHNIDTKEKAYWLGFLFADGYVNKAESSMSLNLSDKDEEQIDRFLKAVGLENNDFKRYYGPYKNTGKFVQIAIANREFVAGLIKNGCTNKKTFTAVLPDFKDEGLDLAFLLGYYDGDGSASCADLTCGNLEFLQSIKEKYNLPYDIRQVKNPRGSAFVLNLGNELKRTILSNFEFSMLRKREKRKMKFVLDGLEYKCKITKCPACSREFVYSATKYCSLKCFHATQKRKFEIKKEELKTLISLYPMTTIGKMLGVSDNAVRKRAKRLGLEYKKKKV